MELGYGVMQTGDEASTLLEKRFPAAWNCIYSNIPYRDAHSLIQLH